jgi:hypothetical protein
MSAERSCSPLGRTAATQSCSKANGEAVKNDCAALLAKTRIGRPPLPFLAYCPPLTAGHAVLWNSARVLVTHSNERVTGAAHPQTIRQPVNGGGRCRTADDVRQTESSFINRASRPMFAGWEKRYDQGKRGKQ